MEEKPRRDAAATKARILDAAKQCFSDVGYAAAGIRDVAAVAGVSYTLVGRYYGSKAGLLEAALIDSTSIDPVLSGLSKANFGERLARLIAEGLSDRHPTAMTILAAADPIARAVATRVVESRVVKPLADWIGEPHGHDRALAITMLGGGFVTYSQHLPLLKLPIGPNHPLVGWLARSFQEIIDNPASWRAPDMLPKNSNTL